MIFHLGNDNFSSKDLLPTIIGDIFGPTPETGFPLLALKKDMTK